MPTTLTDEQVVALERLAARQPQARVVNWDVFASGPVVEYPSGATRIVRPDGSAKGRPSS